MDVRWERARLLAFATLGVGCASEMAEPQVEEAQAQLEAELLRADFEGGEIPFLQPGSCSVSSAAASAGSGGYRCDDDSTVVVVIPTMGYEDITVSYSRSTSRYDAGEALYVEVSYDSQSWETLETVTGTTGHAAQTWALAPAANDSQAQVRFRSTASGFYEYFDLDQLVARGSDLNAGDPTCDGIDDDGDGSIDEDFAEQASSCGDGACAATGTLSCVDGQLSDSCMPGVPAPTDATCDGVDDDCDGLVDEDCASASVTAFESDFESGLGQFESIGSCATSSAAAHTGSTGVRCDDDASIEARFSTVGLRDLTLSYYRRAERYDSGESFYAELSRDGSAWVALEQLGGTTSYAQATLPIPATFADQDDVRLRFRANASGFYERFDVDDVRIAGSADTHNEVRMLPTAGDFFAMPWPSDHRRTADGTLELAGFPGLDEAQGGLGPMLRGNIEPNVRGFGTNTAAFFTMKGALDPRALPAPTSYTDDGAAVMLVNLSNPAAARIPVLVDMKGAPTVARPGRLLSVMPYPGFSLEPETRYAVILFDNLAGWTAGLSRAPLLDRLASGDVAGSGLDAADFAMLQSHKAEVDGYVEGHTAHAVADVVAFTVYTTQAIGKEFTGAVASVGAMSDADILARVDDLNVIAECPEDCEGPSRVYCNSAKLDATIQVPLYQTPADFAVDLSCFAADGARCMSTSGGDFVLAADGTAQVQSWQTAVKMRILVPCLSNRPSGGWPSIVFAEGTGGNYNAADRVERMYNDTPTSGTQPWLSLDHVVGSITPYQSEPRNDPSFVQKIAPFYEALTAGSDIVGGLDGFTYAFEFNPVFARTNSIQNAVDAVYLRRVVLLLDQIADKFGVTAADLGLTSDGFVTDPARTTLQGQSQGSHSAPLVLSVPPAEGGFQDAYLNASGGDLFFERAAHRHDMRPFMEQLFKMVPGEIDRFHPVSHLLQTAKEPGASLNYASRVAAPGHILITNGYQDGCSLRETTSAVATAMVRANSIEVADTSAAFQAVGAPMPPVFGVQTVLQQPLVRFGAGISGNLSGQTRLFLMLEGGHYGSGSEYAVANYLHDLGMGITPTMAPPPYSAPRADGSCNTARIE